MKLPDFIGKLFGWLPARWFEHKYTKYRPAWCNYPDFESIDYCWGLALAVDEGKLDEFYKRGCKWCDCKKEASNG